MSYTPVVPPFPSPGGASQQPGQEHAPPMPQFSPNSQPPPPAWAQQQSFPAQSPYGGGVTMQAPPGSYFIPPVALPQGAHTPVAPVGPSGYSADWVGYPYNASAGMGTPFVMQQGMLPPGQPHQGHPAMRPPPGTGYMYPQHLPPQMQPQMQSQMPPPGYPSPHHGMWGMPMAAAAYGTPYAMPQMAGTWTTPYAQTGALPGHGPGVPLPGGAQPPPAVARTESRPARPQDVTHFDKIDKFAEGEHYGPVLDPYVLRRVKAKVEVNPLLLPPPEELNREHLKWNMLFPTAQCQRSTDPANRSWAAGRGAPATWPRLTSLRLVSRVLAWPVEVKATDILTGVTCGDIIETLHQYMYQRVSQSYYDGANAQQKRVLQEAFYHNRSTALGVPGGRLPQTLLRCDWLGRNTTFGGIVYDEQAVRDMCYAHLPAVFELKCVEPWPVSEEEQRTQEDMLRRADEATQRSSRSRATSRATSRTASRAGATPAMSRTTSRATSRSRTATVEDDEESE